MKSDFLKDAQPQVPTQADPQHLDRAPCAHSASSRPCSSAAPAWAQHLAATATATATDSLRHNGTPASLLTTAEACRVQRHHDSLMTALQDEDRLALVRAKQNVLNEAYQPQRSYDERGRYKAPGAADGEGARTCGADNSPALRRALRDLSWRMAAWLVPRSAGERRFNI